MFKYIFMAVLGSCCATVSFGTEIPTACPVKQGVCDASKTSEINCNKPHAKAFAKQFRKKLIEAKVDKVAAAVPAMIKAEMDNGNK